jgi:hypothetical protein
MLVWEQFAEVLGLLWLLIEAGNGDHYGVADWSDVWMTVRSIG